MTQYDPWAGESTLPEYDPEKVYHAAVDKRGHGTTVKVNLPSGIPGQIAQIIGATSELRTVQDFYRDCIAHGIYRWKERLTGGDLPSDWGNSILQHFIMEDSREKMQVDQGIIDGYRDQLRNARTEYQRQGILFKAVIASDIMADPDIADQLRKLQ